ncbi:MAG: hypothetical protein IJN70_04180 [Clostridia bacterium]|nr:hypothetical protein [Clostridia bacterium]
MKVISIGLVMRYIPYQTQYKHVQTYLFNKRTFEFEQMCTVLKKLKITEEEFSPWDYDFIPLPDLSYAHTRRDYLSSCHRKDAEFILKQKLDDVSLEGCFGDETELHFFWYQHHLRIVKQKAIEWCEDYGIPYIDDRQTIKPMQIQQSGEDC